MSVLWWVLAGVAGGVLGGMGFGGGTLLIPILTFFAGVPTRTAIWVNLLAFLPSALVSLLIHGKRGMVEKGTVCFLLAFAFLGVFLALPLVGKLSESLIEKAFGIFLILLGSISMILLFVGYFKEKYR